jgi:hypothetical protein
MNKRSWLATCLALMVAGTLLGADLGWAQAQGGGPQNCPQYQGAQGRGQGRGPNYQNCPNYQANANCPQGQVCNLRGRRGPRGGGANNPTSTPNPAPEVNK